MSWSFARCLALGAVVASAAACGASGGDTGANTGAAQLRVRFEQSGVLTTAPGVAVHVGVVVSGPGTDASDVTFWLDGDYEDGSLDADQSRVTSGHATVSLRAPSTPATFAIHAKIAGADARLDVAVSASGFGTVQVNPEYQGKRAAPAAVASIFLKAPCSELATKDLVDGAPVVDGTATTPLTIPSVPAGTPAALVVRIGHYASGCVDLGPIVANAVRTVDAAIYDRPMALDRTNLDAVFQFDPEPADRVAWKTMLDNGQAKALAAFIPSTTGDPDALLGAMRAAAPAMAAPDYDTNRNKNGWDAKATTWLSSHAPTMRTRIQTWMDAGEPDALGDLLVHLDPGTGAGLAAVTLESFGKLSTGAAGLTTRVPFGWLADLSDTVHLQGAVYMRPSALVCDLADLQASKTAPGATDAASALASASEIDCNGLAASLLGTTGQSYPGCGTSCTADLCRNALAAMWQNGRDASATALEETAINLAMSAHADVGDAAEPIAFQGAWSAQVTAPGQTFSLKGTANAAATK